MLTSRKQKPIKQGWILKKGGAGLFAQWKPKFISMVPKFKGYSLLVYDDRDQTKKPKHDIPVQEVRIEVKPAKFALLSRGAVPFTLYAKGRKFHFACHTKTEHQEWIQLIENLCNNLDESGNGDDLERSASRLQRKRYDDSDARSIYSVASQNDDDETMSVISGVSNATSNYEREERHSIVSSTVDTLSFCSEPVLTPYELNMLGSENLETEDAKSRNPLLKRKEIEPDLVADESWYNRFIFVMNQDTVTEEAMMQKGDHFINQRCAINGFSRPVPRNC
jgi:hypothetical protein